MDNIASKPIQTAPDTHVPSVNSPIVASTPVEETATTFEAVNQMPYTAKHFGISKSQYFALQQADITDLSPKMTAIEQYVRERITTEKFVDSTTTFDAMMRDIRNSLGIKDYETPAAQIEKIFTYITQGKGMVRKFHLRRSNLADERTHAHRTALDQLNKTFPNKTNKLRGLLNTFTR